MAQANIVVQAASAKCDSPGIAAPHHGKTTACTVSWRLTDVDGQERMPQPATEQAQARRLAQLFPGIAAPPPAPWRRWLTPALLLLPTLFAILYYGVVASPLYVSQAQFLVRSGLKESNALGGISALLQLVGASHSHEDVYVVRDFLQSRDALRQIEARLDLSAMFHNTTLDPAVRYPSPLYPATQEGLYRYFRRHTAVYVDLDSGIAKLSVDGLRPADTRLLSLTMLELGEGLVNKLNTRMRASTIDLAEQEVTRAQKRRIDAEVALTAFRNRVLMLDPAKTATMVLDVIGKLAETEAETRAQISALRATAPTSPQLPPLIRRAAALHQQIADEQARMGGGKDGLAAKIATYEELVLEQGFSNSMLVQAMASLQAARNQARRQALFVERVVEPNLPTQPTEPHRIAWILTVFGFNILGAGMAWLLFTGLREHAAGQLKTRSPTR